MSNPMRLNPNQAQSQELQTQLHMRPETVVQLIRGRPYYSLAEVVLATGLPATQVNRMFVLPTLAFPDKVTGQQISFLPVPGFYVIPSRPEFEGASNIIEQLGYKAVLRGGQHFGFSIVAPISWEEEQQPHVLKGELAGKVHPLLRDAEGFERILVPGSLDLWFRHDVLEERRLRIIQHLGLMVTQAVPNVGYYRVRLSQEPEDQDITRAVMKRISVAVEFEEVNFAEPDQVGFDDFGPSLERPEAALEFEEADQYWNEAVIELTAAHAITRGSPNVTIIVVDSGCRTDHEELAPGLREGWGDLDLCFALGAPDPDLERSPYEEVIAHGTKVAGVVRRVAPNCRILPIKISGDPIAPAYGLRAAAIRQALTYLGPGERAVLNLSWSTNGDIISIREALIEAHNKGVVIVSSAGNYQPGVSQQSDAIHYPSGYSWLGPKLAGLCAAAAIATGDIKSSYSYFGAHSITLSAPGGERGEAGTGIYTTSTPEKHAYVAGTSFAAPHVAGVLGLLLAQDPSLSPEAAVKRLKDSTDPVDLANPALIGQLGTGRLNALRALGGTTVVNVIRAVAGPNGAIVPLGDVAVPVGSDFTFSIIPAAGYVIEQVLVDGIPLGPITEHTFSAVSGPHTIEAHFQVSADSHFDGQGRLRINLATADELMTLPPIGAWLASNIVAYRSAHGPFANIWQLSLAGVSGWVLGQIAKIITL